MSQIKIKSSLLLEAYCYARQAERGLDAALSASWEDFCRSYVESYYDKINMWCEAIVDLVGDEAASSYQCEPNFWRAISRIARGLKRRPLVITDNALLQFARTCFRKLLTLVVSKTASPEVAVLTKLKEDFTTIWSAIELHLSKADGLEKANCIEHYGRTEWLPRYSVDEILDPREGSGRAHG